MPYSLVVGGKTRWAGWSKAVRSDIAYREAPDAAGERSILVPGSEQPRRFRWLIHRRPHAGGCLIC